MVTPVRIGRYELHDEIALGGMASVHLGRYFGGAGFSRIVAIKRLHRQYAKDPEYVEMFLDEANLAARVRHPNVVAISDVVATEEELFLVMDYIPGMSVAQLCRALGDEEMPAPIALRIASDALQGLHAVHTAIDDDGQPLDIVHRDVSPENLLVGADGVTRVIDFGVAKGRGRVHRTRTGVMKGKLAYAAPEQILGERLDCRTDLYSMGVTIWRMFAGALPVDEDADVALMHRKVTGELPQLSTRITVPSAIDAAVARATLRNREERFDSAVAMHAALLGGAPEPASAQAVAQWVAAIASGELGKRADRVTQILELPEVTANSQTMPAHRSASRGTAATVALVAATAAIVLGVRSRGQDVAVAAATFG
ncbi:MAG TPA: serine/threonine-protein kinase, partial [Polyangiaceae bacterium]|nr:serine/threonine-protein kinase [Polyangiaceae bacterium]